MEKRKIFFDTEFTGLHQKTELLSIGFISECGQSFYAEISGIEYANLNSWLQDNVVKNLKFTNVEKYVSKGFDSTFMKGSCEEIKTALEEWFSKFNQVEIWADVAHYDWVLFCQIFGGAFSIPQNIGYICFDIATLMVAKNINPDISRVKFVESKTTQQHNALADAELAKACYNKLMLL